MAFVLPLMAFLIFSGQMFQSSIPTSVRMGIALQYLTLLDVAMKVDIRDYDFIPAGYPAAASARCRAIVPLCVATAC